MRLNNVRIFAFLMGVAFWIGAPLISVAKDAVRGEDVRPVERATGGYNSLFPSFFLNDQLRRMKDDLKGRSNQILLLEGLERRIALAVAEFKELPTFSVERVESAISKINNIKNEKSENGVEIQITKRRKNILDTTLKEILPLFDIYIHIYDLIGKYIIENFLN